MSLSGAGGVANDDASNGTIELDDDDDDEDNEESIVTEFLEQDLEHLKFKLFCVPKSMAVRIFSINIQFYKWQDMVADFLSASSQSNDTELKDAIANLKQIKSFSQLPA